HSCDGRFRAINRSAAPINAWAALLCSVIDRQRSGGGCQRGSFGFAGVRRVVRFFLVAILDPCARPALTPARALLLWSVQRPVRKRVSERAQIRGERPISGEGSGTLGAQTTFGTLRFLGRGGRI
ncbi:MAG TPA: hypothetical protein VKY73_00965, partial [Polyangiaceae bacterium]|nr:hypothetical protein [Polyangiaceae bacterium]